MTLPSLRARSRALLTFDADKHHRHPEDDRARRRSPLVTIAAKAQVSTRLVDALDAQKSLSLRERRRRPFYRAAASS